jgi:hypothetical protein
MTDSGVPDSEMFRWQTRPEFRALEALLSGSPEDAPAGLRPVAEVLAALQAPPDPGEFAGWNRALTTFRQTPPEVSPRPRSRGRRLGTRLAAVAAAAAVAAFGGGIAAAYTGHLPVSLQRIAHDTIAAPAPGASPGRPATPTAGDPTGPDVTGSAAHGLCTAYAQAKAHGNASQRSEAFRKLVEAAGGEDKVAVYCGSVPNPGVGTPPGHAKPSAPAASSPAHPRHHGKPTAKPSHANGKKS